MAPQYSAPRPRPCVLITGTGARADTGRKGKECRVRSRAFSAGCDISAPRPQFAPSNFRFAHRRSRLLTGGMGEAQEAACRKADEAQKPVGHLHRDER